MDTSTILTIIGIVVAVVIGLWQIQLARKQINHSSNSQSPTDEQSLIVQDSNFDEHSYREQPYPSEIFNITNQLPLLQRHEARNKYAGLKVKWHGTIQNLFLENSNTVALTVRVDDHGTYTYVYCKVKSTDYPEVKVAKDGHGILVYGEIKYMGNTDVELTNCKIKLD